MRGGPCSFARAGGLTALALCAGLSAPFAEGARITVKEEAIGPTPEILAYNLGHFYPGSNTTDWWRYSRASGARMFMAPSHFETGWTARPGDADVTSREAFIARRAALRQDPYNIDFINWPAVEGRFSIALTSNNRIVPRYAFEEIQRHGGTALVQMTLSESAFPIAGEEDWRGKWVAWRVYYSLAFYLAREFGIERFSSHNEPNHSASFIAPDAWLMRLRLASDAAQSAIEDVNRIYNRELTPIFTAPVTASATGNAYNDYGRPAIQGIQTNFLGETDPDFSLVHLYAYQQYNQSPGGFVSNLNNLRNLVAADLPPGASPLPFALTEFNVHTGATYDTLPETPDSLNKVTRLGAILNRLMLAEADELYLFKFGMTAYPTSRNFPVQKNGMLYADNNNAPYNHGSMTRGAEAYRLFNKAFARGRQLLSLEITGAGASDLVVAASHDPETGFYYLFSVNETTSGIPFELDLSELDLPEGNHLIVEDVSQWRTGLIRSMHQIQNGQLAPGNQPGQTVWLITIPGRPQKNTAAGEPFLEIAVSKDAMVRDGNNASTNYGDNASAWAKNDPENVNGRNVAFLQFDLPEDWSPDLLELAVLTLPIATINGQSGYVQAHLYGIDNHDWDESTITWANAPNLRTGVPAGKEIRHGVVDGAGDTAHVLAQLTVSGGYISRQVDVTDYLRRQTGGKASFMIVQDPRWDIDIHVSDVPDNWSDLPRGDLQTDGIRIRTKEGAGPGQPASSLTLIEAEPQPVDFSSWIQSVFPEITDPAVISPQADPNGSGLPNLLEFALGRDPASSSRERIPQVARLESGEIGFIFSRNTLAGGLSVEVESSFDLLAWSSDNLRIETTAQGAVITDHFATLDTRGAERAFFRLRVTVHSD